jgi:DnaJ-class molecular chaperone
MSDLYQTLDVSPQAGLDDIKRSYRKIVRECHPDLNPSPAAEVRFKRVSVAYAVLSDPQQRALYDEFGEESLQPGFDPHLARRQQAAQARQRQERASSPFGDMNAFHDALGAIFGGMGDEDAGAPPPREERNTWGRQEAYESADQSARASIPAMVTFVGGITAVQIPRPGGRFESVRVRIRPGAKSGDTVRVPGQGSPSRYGPPGDLMVILDVEEHPVLRRTGDDLEMEVPITLLEAVQGGPIEVPTPTGPARVSLPPNCAGAKLRLRGRGVQRPGAPGHLILTLRAVLPERVDGEVLDACRTIERAYGRSVRDRLRL